MLYISTNAGLVDSGVLKPLAEVLREQKEQKQKLFDDNMKLIKQVDQSLR